MSKEEWKPIEGFNGLYEISNKGMVRNASNQKIKKQHVDNVGYYAVSLSKNNRIYLHRVHRLIAIAFIPNPLNLPCINHKDENKLNNSIENLEWCTKAYNNTYGGRVGRITNKKKKIVLQIKESGEIIKEWDSVKQAATVLNLSEISISRYARGVIQGMYHGCYWRYKKPTSIKRQGKRVGKFDANGNLLDSFDSIIQAGVLSGISPFTISNCINGRLKMAGNYYWKTI